MTTDADYYEYHERKEDICRPRARRSGPQCEVCGGYICRCEDEPDEEDDTAEEAEPEGGGK